MASCSLLKLKSIFFFVKQKAFETKGVLEKKVLRYCPCFQQTACIRDTRKFISLEYGFIHAAALNTTPSS